MKLDFLFFSNSILLGVALAMDAFSVSVADGLKATEMKKSKFFLIAGTFAFFQFLMPLAGWLIIHFLYGKLDFISRIVPFIAFFLLIILGLKMIVEGVKEKKAKEANTVEVVQNLTFPTLFFQSLATSIDALSVGFTTASYSFFLAFLSSVIIAIVTFFICICGLLLGKTVGKKLSSFAPFLGGMILVLIGLEILITSFI